MECFMENLMLDSISNGSQVTFLSYDRSITCTGPNELQVV